MGRTRGDVAARATAVEWRERVRRWEASGLQASAFAAQIGVKASSLTWWKWRLGSERDEAVEGTETAPSFVPVVLRATKRETSTSSGVEVVAGRGMTVRIATGFDEPTLRRVLAIVAEEA